jgi:hypothetical protein
MRPRLPQPDLLLRALAPMLRPLIRLLIRAGVTFPSVSDLLRSLYVDVAASDLLTEPGARTDSRISLLTGVHRKEIRRQRTIASPVEPHAITLSSLVMARWLGAEALTGADGRPLPLPRLGAAPSFEALVSSVTRDIRPRALLDDWLDQGIATLDEQGMVRLEHTAFVPHADRDAQLFYFGRNLHDHLAAAADNVAAPGAPPFLDRSVHYDGLSPEAAARIAEAARTAAVAALLEVNRAALAIADADDAAAKPGDVRRCRVNLGLYLFSEEKPTDDAR